MIATLLSVAERMGVGRALLVSLFAALFSLSAKAFGAILGLVAFAVAARGMSESEFGALVVAFSVASFLATVGVLGQDALIIRNWAETRAEKNDGASLGALLFGAGVTLVSGFVVALGFALLCRVNAAIEPQPLPLPGGLGVIVAASVFLFAQAQLHFVSHAARAICGVRVSEPHSEVTWRLMLVVVFPIATQVDRENAVAAFFSAAALGCLLATGVQIVAILRDLEAAIRAAAPVLRIGAWSRRSAGIFSAVVAEAASLYADVVVIGAVASPAVSAAYFVVARIAGVFPMIAAGLHGYLSSRFANLYYARRRDEAQRLIGRVMSLAALVFGLLGLTIILFGDRLLGLFGAAYAAEQNTLLALSAGAIFSALMGPGAIVLLATGHEIFYSRFLIASILARALGLALLAPAYGAFGAALAVAVVAAPVSAVVAFFCRRKVGVDPSIIGAWLPPK